MRYALALWLALCGSATAQVGQVPMFTQNASAAHSIAFTTFVNGPISSTVAGSGTYTGTAPTSITAATYGGTTCTGSSTVTGFSAGGGTWSATFSTPSVACTGNLAITDNLGDSSTSPNVAMGFPGDIVSSAAFWGGMRAYNSTLATSGTTFAVQLTKVINSVSCDILLTNKGALGVTVATCNSSTQGGLTPTAFAGTDATGNATSAGTAVALTGLSSAAHQGDVITGTGFLGSYCVSVGALVAGAQTCTTNTSQSIGVSEPVTLTNALLCNRVYDQTIAANVGFTTIVNNAYFIPTGGASATTPWCATDGTSGFSETLAGGNVGPPATVSTVNFRRSGTVSAAMVQNGNGGGANFTGLVYNAANSVVIFAGSVTASVTAADQVWHAFQGVINGSSSSIMVDGTLTSSLVAGAQGFFALAGFNVIPNGTGGAIGGGTEWGIWSGAISSGNQSLINANQHAYWGY